MGVLKKVVKSVVKAELSNLTGTSSNDVKIAKLELQKAKLDRKKEQEQDINSIVNYVGTNIDHFKDQIVSLTEDVKARIIEYESSNFRNRNILSRDIEEKLQYLHLSKVFFSLLGKAASGVSLQENQVTFVIKFLPFFDGTKVLSVFDVGDMSALNAFKEIGAEFASAFVPVKKPFSFSDFMGEYNATKDNLTIPDVESSIALFEKIYEKSVLEHYDHDISSKAMPSTVCPNCNATVLRSSKFCSECGAKLSPSNHYCPACGNQCDLGMKFCPSCGNKLLY